MVFGEGGCTFLCHQHVTNVLVFCDNNELVKNTTIPPESMLAKKRNAISYYLQQRLMSG